MPVDTLDTVGSAVEAPETDSSTLPVDSVSGSYLDSGPHPAEIPVLAPDTVLHSVASTPFTSDEHPTDAHMQDTIPHTELTVPALPTHLLAETFHHEQTDSLSTAARDRSQDYPFRTYCTADSAQYFFDMARTAASSRTQPIVLKTSAPYRNVSAQTVFGRQSTLVPPSTEATAVRRMTDNSLFQGFALLLAVTYILLIYHNILDIRTLLNRVFHDQTSGERRFEDPGGSRYTRFIRTTAIIGILFIGILVVKYTQPTDLAIPVDRFMLVAALVLSLVVSTVILLILGFQWTLLRLVGAITLTQPLITQLQQLRKVYFSSAVVLITPALLLFALGPQQTEKLWLGLIAVGFAVTLFLYLRETLNLFLSKKISIIHWILYLCSVEFFPVSLLWQLAVR